MRRLRRDNTTGSKRTARRKHLLETLESRQLLAGPQLIGIQPNQGALIEDGTQRDTAPRVLTFGFDEAQRIDTDTTDGIRITRSGPDGTFNTADDVRINPGLVTLGDPNENEVVVRFVEALPDDNYRIEVFGYDDDALGVKGLRNLDNEFFMPSDPSLRSEVIDFELKLGGLVESVVPQPVIRLADGSLSQNRNEIVVYFNEDQLFVEDDANGNPTARSAENTRFYQLLFTQETVRTTDDLRIEPIDVVYDAATHTSRLIFADDINELSGNPGGGTWRLRIGTAVDNDVDLILVPFEQDVLASAVTDFQHPGLRVSFEANAANGIGENSGGFNVSFVDSAVGGLTATVDVNGNVVFDFGGSTPTVSDLKTVAANTAAVANKIVVNFAVDSDTAQGGDLIVPRSVIGAAALQLNAAGDTLSTSLDVGVFGQLDPTTNTALKSIVLSESISPKPYAIELAGGQDDPGHTDEVEHINSQFGADAVNGVTEVAYNFNRIFDTDGSGNEFLNQITDRQKVRIREALNLWSKEIGVQFRETQAEGITFALGDTDDLQNRGTVRATDARALDAAVRVDPDFVDSALVFSNQVVFGTAYGEDFTRKAVAGIGLLLGLNQSNDLEAPTIMSFDPSFLDIGATSSIDSLTDLEPVFPGNVDVLHGQFVHRTDSIDVDLYRFEVDLGDPDKVGDLTAETFAERLPDSSLLDTSLTLFQEVSATANTSLGLGPELNVQITSMLPGLSGNNSQLQFIQTDRFANDIGVKIRVPLDSTGQRIANAVIIDLPRIGPNVATLSAAQVVAAINSDPLSSSLFRAEILNGQTELLRAGEIDYSPLLLDGGGLVKLSRNDDYFSEDSRIKASLGEGVYFIGVSASGNDQYDPTIPDSGFGGRTQGRYDLHLKFEPQVDEVDVIRDLDSDRTDVPGTALDGDGDGVPGGVHNFWFQTRPLNRIVEFTDSGDAIVPGQTVRLVGANGVVRTFEFTPIGSSPTAGNIEVSYTPGGIGFPTPPGNLAAALQAAINSRAGETGVTVSRDGATLEFTGDRSVNFSTNFRGANALGRNIFVDKTAGPQADGSLARPFNNITNPVVANAFGSAIEGDIVRIVGNGGLDNQLATEEDNFSYQIGVSDTGGTTLEDGRNMEVPKGVTTIIDAGAILKLRNSFIGIGSSTLQVDRSGGVLQVLGTPRLVQLSAEGDPVTTTLISGENVEAPGYDDGSVIFTSTRDRQADANASGISAAATPGNWGGIIYRRDLDQAQGRRDHEDEGIFLQRVNHAEIRYGGGSNVLIDSVQQLVNPIQIVNMRPTVTFNEITQSADSAISAAPNSFEETSYQAPEFQQAGAFTADYDRVGPEMHSNQLVDNSVNGVFIRATTTPTERPKEFTIAGRFDDIDVVHYVSENLVVAAEPGGSIVDGIAPSMALVSGQVLAGGVLAPGTYQYKMTFVDDDGFESLASADSFSITVTNPLSSVQLSTLVQVEADTDYVSRRLYRADASGQFRLVADLDASSSGFVDGGEEGEAILDLTRQGVRGRLDASLVLDPGLIVKLRGARIELGHGTQLLAEGLGSNPVVFTSSLDDRFGTGGTFDTNNDGITGDSLARRGDWSGIYAGPGANVSLDHAQVSYAGGISLIEGGLARGFLALELQQADGRITNSTFEFNDDGQDGAGPAGRLGRLAVTEATIMVRGSQPIIAGNTFVDNRGSVIDIDIESLNGDYNIDLGRQTGDIDRYAVLDDNHGPAIRFNRFLNLPVDLSDPGIQLSGLEVRAGTISTETIFDDTDIAHLLFDNIEVGNFHSSGGLRLLSRPDESLVVKFSGPGGPNSATEGTGITATGSTASIDDRIGGSVHIIGLPGSPVILTSLEDDTAGAGLKPDGSQFTDHDGDGLFSRPFANDWRGILLDQYSNDYNVPVLPELELSTEVAPGLNATVENAQFLGELAADVNTGDHVRRLGFEVEGFLSGTTDVDVYSFIGSPGTEVWIDIDKTSLGLDTVIELLDETGAVLARSDDSSAETALVSPTPLTVLDPDLQGVTTSLQAGNEQYTERGAGGLYEDFGSTNTRDAGIHFRLAGNTSAGSRSVYFFRVRSASINPDDAQGGITGGNYRVQARLTEAQQFPGSVVRYSDIRYANTGIHVQGLMSSSPLLGEAQENENGNFFAGNDTPVGTVPGSGGQYVGNLVDGNRNVISVGGTLASASDVDFYHFEVDYANGTGVQSTIFDIDYAAGFNRPDTNISIFYDPDGIPQYGGTGSFEPRLVFFGSSSNIADDLTSPGGENSAIEKLIRGSVSDGDPFIGPVALPEGTYFVAVTSDGVSPTALLNTLREPINSVDRLVEDRVDRANPESYSTKNDPSIDRLFSDSSLVGSGFSIATDSSLGHGKPNHFDGTTGPNFISGAPRISEFTVTGGNDAESDIIFGQAFSADLESQNWSLADDFSIGGNAQGFGAESTATTIPHVSITGNLANDAADFYQFIVPTTNGQNISQRVILDIDNGYDTSGEIDDDGDPVTPPVNFDQSSVDATLLLLEEDPNNPGTLREALNAFSNPNTDSFSLNNGAGGSNSLLDPYISATLQPGVYYVGVLEEGTTYAIDATGVRTTNDAVTGGLQSYTLHVSVGNHVLPPSATQISNGQEVIAFDRIANAVPGSVLSEAFDLSGYVPEDLPTLYLNRLFQPVPGPGGIGDDSATLSIVTDSDPVGTQIHVFSSDNDAGNNVADDWRQLRLSLGDFAGESGVRLRVDYVTNGLIADSSPQSTERGLFLDDFIVGFAERGETIFNSSSDASFIGTGFGAVSGEYQLEMRHGTDYATATGGGNTQLDFSFDTNDRHNRSVTLVAPDGTQISDGQTFVIGDGASNQTFEFSTDANVTFGNTRVSFAVTDTAAQVAQSIRTALNSQTAINIEASTSGGLDVQSATDGRLALSGNATGTFQALTTANDAPATGTALTTGPDGNLLIPAVLHDGVGDENFLRTQGQIIVENNVISDVRGIGVWSEPGQRQVDPSHNFDNPYLDTLHLGNSSPGAVRNLPTLNDSVLGGLAPGIVIQNNTIDQAEFAGVKIDGDINPFMIIPPVDALVTTGTTTEFFGSGDFITDGSTFAIDAGGTRVVFEFEDISQGDIPTNHPAPFGSLTDGGDGVRDGHVPVYIRHTDSNPASQYLRRVTPYTAVEVANSIRESIQGSILMSNSLAELVEVEIGPSLFGTPTGTDVDFSSPAVYIFGASGIYQDFRDGRSFGELTITQAPLAQAPQPFARIVNNTIYGDDGTESNFPGDPLAEPNDFLSQAVDTKLGSSHRGPFFADSGPGSTPAALESVSDVDFYRVYLEVGDRLVVDIDTLDADPNDPNVIQGPDTAVRIFDSSGVAVGFLDQSGTFVTISSNDTAPNHLDPRESAAVVRRALDPNIQDVNLPNVPGSILGVDAVNDRDPFVDFRASETGTYFVGVSSEGNVEYDPFSSSGRVPGTGGGGLYDIGIEVYAPRSFVISANHDNNGRTANPPTYTDESDRDGIRGSDVIGTTFTITQIPDLVNLDQGDDYSVDGEFFEPNEIIFLFVQGTQVGRVVSPVPGSSEPEGYVEIDVDADYRLPDIMEAIENMVGSIYVGNNQPTIPNDVIDQGPIPRAKAAAAGGIDGSSAFIADLGPRTFLSSEGIVDNELFYPLDFNTFGFGHRMTLGSTEQYALIENVAEITLSPEAIAAGLRLDPQPNRDTDQLINETGVMVAGGASPTLLNNVFLNLHESVVREETRFDGFGEARRGSDQHPKPMEVIVVGSVFQHDEPRMTQHNQDLTFSRYTIGTGGTGLTTSAAPSNVNGGTDDFNVTLGDNDPAVRYAEGSNFQPADGAVLIDSSVSSLVERDALVNLKNSIGLPISNILAPNIDVAGILRADNPNFAPPGGIGASIFIDRGSSELADFVGPIAIAEAPRDNDADGVDADPAISFIDLTSGVYDEFRIQLRDTGDASDPFAGIGIDDSTVVVPAIPGVRPSGANISLFENDTLLTEGIQYTFNYDETKNIITLTPLAGIWKNDASYRISLNNQDRTVVTAAAPADIRDGDQFSIADSDGGTVVFEFETGYQLQLPEPLTLVVPREGTNSGGIRDGDIFVINDGVNPSVVFEYNSDTAKLPGTVAVPLPATATPLDADQLQIFLEEIALSTATVISNEVTAGRLDVDVRVVGEQLIMGAERGATVTTNSTGLQQLSRTLGLLVPNAGSDPVNGVVDGDTFTLDNGSTAVTFEFSDGTGTPNPANTIVNIAGNASLTTAQVATAILQSVVSANLGLNPQIIGNTVYLDLPAAGSLAVSSGRLSAVGVARPPADGDTLTLTPNDGSAPVVLEIDRIDQRDVNGDLIPPGVSGSNIPISGIERSTTSLDLANALADAITGVAGPTNTGIAGLDANSISVVGGGRLVIGGQQGLGLSLNSNSLSVAGSPAVAGASTIQVFGPLLLNMPTVGGGAIMSGEVLIVKDQFGNDVLFEFVSNQGGVQTLDGGFNTDGSQRPLSIVVPFNTFDTDAQIATTLQGLINAQNIGLNAQLAGVGQVSLGRVDASRVNTAGDPANGISGINQVTVQRGIVADQELLIIRQGTNEVRFEFEEATVGGGVTSGNVQVAFQAGSSVFDVAQALAAAINNNAGTLRFTGLAVATPEGEVILNDVPGTVVDVSAAPTLNIVGVPGGAQPVLISPSFTATEVKLAILEAINGVNRSGQLPFTTLMARDRGGDTLFVENALSFAGNGISTYFLPAIKDLSGNPLEANREDLSTQFTILMPVSAVDFGDAPDPVSNVPGRYPTLFANNGPRHVIGTDLTLGRTVDVDLDGRPTPLANGDDQVISVVSSGSTFTTSVVNGIANIEISQTLALNGDGDTITIDTGVDSAILELDLDGIFDEDSFAIRPTLPLTTASIADAINVAIAESPLRPATTVKVGVDEVSATAAFGSTFTTSIAGGVADIQIDASNAADGDTVTITVGTGDDAYQATLELDFDNVATEGRIAIRPTESISNASIGAALARAIASSDLSQAKISIDSVLLPNANSLQIIADDEDGVKLTSELNPGGVLNKGAETPIEVSVYGSGVLQAWIDFNADGDWDDPGELVIDPSLRNSTDPLVQANGQNAVFVDPTGSGVTKTFTIAVPDTTPVPPSKLTTYARFRVSREGGLLPTGLALSGEVEDYSLLILPGGPPTLTDAQANRTYNVSEGGTLSALDSDGTLTPLTTNDDGLLNTVIDPDGDQVEIFADDVGTFTLFSGSTKAGDLTIFDNGTFTFASVGEFNGEVKFTTRVTDVRPLDPTSQIVNNRAITTTINVTPINDPPRLLATPTTVLDGADAIDEDTPLLIEKATLIDPFYVAGPANELDQPLVIQSVRSLDNNINGESTEGGSVEILNGGTTVRYTPRLNFNGTDTFVYVVADVPGAGQLSQASPVLGTVTIEVKPVNDAPIAGEDLRSIQERQTLTFGINSATGQSVLLDNDLPGPSNESDQTISLTATQSGSFQGGTVTTDAAGEITYTPPAFFSGTDSFTYTITDSGTPNQTSTGVVTISVGGENDNPIFVGINGDPQLQSLTFDESKETEQSFTYDLSTWFRDPEGDALSFTVSSDNPALLIATEANNILRLRLPSFASGDTNLQVTASDGNGGVLTTTVPVSITPTPDPPRVIAGSDPYVGSEDQNLVVDLRSIFTDPDMEPLTYRFVSLDNLQNPTQAQLDAHPLIQSVGPRNLTDNDPNNDGVIVGNNLIITPKPNQFGTATIVLSASDGIQTVSYVMTVDFESVQDRPIAFGDSYNVPVRSTLQVLNPANGLLRVGSNVADFDPDGDAVRVDLSTVTDPMFGSVSVAADGTFTYVSNALGSVGLVDTFQYRVLDDSNAGLASTFVTVSLTLNQSAYQNPLADMQADVTADGVISPIDILRVINFLAENGDTPVSDTTKFSSPPPDYLDVTGNGVITPADILAVINALADQNARGQGELLAGAAQGELIADAAQGELIADAAQGELIAGPTGGVESRFAVTTAFATSNPINLPFSNRSKVEEPAPSENADDARDQLLTSGISLSSSRLEAVDSLLSPETDADPIENQKSVDEALDGLLDEFSTNSLFAEGTQ
ncbi:tandem-95 repeat protein [Planctomycetes bacterium K23_9]